MTLGVSGYLSAHTEHENSNYLNNRPPLISKPYIELPFGAIRPAGWIEEQMKRQANGLSGNLDEMYPQVMGPRNGWLGGDGDMWERGPYWIDGLLPLAYILNDNKLKSKVQPWVEWALASQKPNGYFGPDTDYAPENGLQRDNSQDWWPRMVVLKILKQYYSATGDERVISFMTNYFRYQLHELPKNPLGKWTFWGEERGGDNLLVVYWLYNITGDEFLLELGDLIHEQTKDWTDIFLHQDHLSRQHSLHCVNLAHGFKEPLIYYQKDKDPKRIESVKKAVKDMRNTIAFPTGLWAGDEWLRFGNPIQGSELCTAVETMYSLEKMLAITGDIQWADQLERIAYNVLPTQISDDCMTRQYYHQINQIRVSIAPRPFVTPHGNTATLFGVLTGFPCCTSNLHQGWPKFVQNLWYATEDQGVAVLLYAPSNVTMNVAGGVPVQIEEITNYPFDENIQFKIDFPDKKVKAVSFPFHLRVPAWCKKPLIRINGQIASADISDDNIVRINREWKKGDELVLELPMQVEVSYWYDGAAVIERGPLLYALKLSEKWTSKVNGGEDRKGEEYYEVTTSSPWNYCFNKKNLSPEAIDGNFIVEKSSFVALYPWNIENAPITIKTQAYLLPEWQEFQGSVGQVVYHSLRGRAQRRNDPETIELIPYGCTTLRIAEFPVRNIIF